MSALPSATRELIGLARTARAFAHTPFSRFKVGAALRARDGQIVTGCNIENATFGLTLCAERVAIFKAVSEGIEGFDAIAIVSAAKRLTPPCGACRQILWEFCGDIPVHIGDLRGRTRTLKMSDLFPLPFDAQSLR
jgi:cytidine deaminase